MFDVIVDRRREKVVSHRERVEVAGQVEVKVLHWDDLAVAATRSTAFDAKGWLRCASKAPKQKRKPCLPKPGCLQVIPERTEVNESLGWLRQRAHGRALESKVFQPQGEQRCGWIAPGH